MAADGAGTRPRRRQRLDRPYIRENGRLRSASWQEAFALVAAKLKEIEARLEALRSPFRTAETFWVEEIIDPRETRNILLHSLERALSRRQSPAEPVARIGITP